MGKTLKFNRFLNCKSKIKEKSYLKKNYEKYRLNFKLENIDKSFLEKINEIKNSIDKVLFHKDLELTIEDLFPYNERINIYKKYFSKINDNFEEYSVEPYFTYFTTINSNDLINGNYYKKKLHLVNNFILFEFNKLNKELQNKIEYINPIPLYISTIPFDDRLKSIKKVLKFYISELIFTEYSEYNKIINNSILFTKRFKTKKKVDLSSYKSQIEEVFHQDELIRHYSISSLLKI